MLECKRADTPHLDFRSLSVDLVSPILCTAGGVFFAAWSKVVAVKAFVLSIGGFGKVNAALAS